MSKPIIVVLSRDQQLSAELPPLFQGRADVRHCDSVDEVHDLVRRLEPQGFVADFRRLGSNAAVEDRLLSSLNDRFPKMRVALLTADSYPESLISRVTLPSVTHLRGKVDLQKLCQAFRELFPADEAANNPASNPAAPIEHPAHAASSLLPPIAEEPALGTLVGMSRRYETNSPQLKQMLADLEVAARHDVTILLIGETGVGKTFLSRLIHEVSPRRHEPFLPVACGALPNDLIESELFGHVKGSFTSSVADKEGKFIAARRGSLLLDEIDVLGLEQQVKLLRVIETGEFEPVGSNQTHRSQARLLVASNLELQPLVEQGRFRPDLYYRLNMLKFVIPPLRQRKMDIIPLAKKFVRQFAVKHQVPIHDVDQGLFNALLNYPWPGNVRELEHVMQRAVIYCSDGQLGAQHLPAHILGGYAGPANDPSVILPMIGEPGMRLPERSLSGQVALTEKEIIEQALFKNNFSRTKTASDLGISRVTLYNKMKRYGLQK